MSATRLDPKLAQAIGLAETVTDPNAIVVAILKKGTDIFKTLENRCCQRTGLTVITIADADPNKRGGQRAKIDLRCSAKDGFGEVGAKIGTFVMRGAGAQAVMFDEARRMVLGMKVGPNAKALDDMPESLVSDETMNLLGPSSARGLFGIDDALLLGAGVTLLCALIPTVLPMLIELGKGAFDMLTGQAAAKDPPPPPPDTNPADGLADALGIGTPGVDDTAKGIAVVAGIILLLGGAWYLLKRRAG